MGLLNLSNIFGTSTNSPKAYWTYQGGTFITPKHNPDTYIDDGYKHLPNLYGIISLQTQKSSSVPFEVLRVVNEKAHREYKSHLVNKNYKKAAISKVKAFEVAEGHEIEGLLNKPNAIQSIEEIWEQMDGYLLLTGNSYLYSEVPGVGMNATRPTELHVLPSPAIEIVPGQGMNEIEGFKLSYFPDPIPKDRMGFVRYFNPINGMDMPQNSLYGMSPLQACRNLLGKYHNADIAQGSMFKNMGPAGILSGKGGDLSEEQARAMQDRFDQFKTGADKAGKISVTSAEVHWQQIGLSPVDLNIIEGKKEILNELCNVYHIPIALFTENNSTDNNMDNARKMFITDAIIPLVEKRKQMLNRWLCPKFGDDIFIEFKYDVFPELQEDLGEKQKWVSELWELTPNQRLRLLEQEENENPLMDKVYVPQNLIPLEDLGLNPQELDVDIIDNNPS